MIYTPKRIAQLVKSLDAYIEKTPVPIIAEFAYQNDIERTALYDNPEFSMLLKKMIAKKESQLEKLCLMNKVNPAMAIFSLKQLGWRDHRGKNGDESSEESVDAALNKIADAMMK